jgi:predicted permease
MTNIWSDLRRSWRVVRRSPGLALAATSALALGIGFTTTMFGIVHGGTRAMPLRDPETIVSVSAPTLSQSQDPQPVDAATFRRWEALAGFERIGAYQSDSVSLSDEGGRPLRVPAARMTAATFELLAERPMLGRWLSADDSAPGAMPVAVIGRALWQTRFAGDPAIVGRSIRIDGVPHQVVGVMGGRFGFPINARLWRPLAIDATDATANLNIVARLRATTSIGAAQAEIQSDLARQTPAAAGASSQRRALVVPFIEVETPREVQRGLQFLVIVVSLTLVVACANVANLLLARAAARTHDVALRTALGASRARLIGLHLTEAVLMSCVAAVAGLALAWAGLRFFSAASAEILQAFWVDFRIDFAVAAFATSLGAFAALAAGLWPAFRATSPDLGPLIQHRGASVARLRVGRLGRGLVVLQVTLACGLMIVTATFLSAATRLHTVAIPFPADDVLTAELSLSPETIASPARRNAFFTTLIEALEASPEFERAALVNTLPGRGAGRWTVDLPVPGAAGRRVTAGVVMVTPGFFALADAGPLQGRLFTNADGEGAAPVALINASFAARHFAGGDALGRSLRIGDREFSVVGVVPDLLVQDIEDRDGAGVYLPMLQTRPFAVRVMALGRGPALSSAAALDRVVAGVDRDLPITEVASLREAIFADKRILDAIATLFFAFGAGALFLSALGLHALLSFLVTQRTHEFGVRMALGASHRDIAHLVARRGLKEVGWGLALGLTLSFAVTRLLSTLLDTTEPAGPGVFALLALAVTGGAALAAWWPLRRAMRMQPVHALRQS